MPLLSQKQALPSVHPMEVMYLPLMCIEVGPIIPVCERGPLFEQKFKGTKPQDTGVWGGEAQVLQQQMSLPNASKTTFSMYVPLDEEKSTCNFPDSLIPALSLIENT